MKHYKVIAQRDRFFGGKFSPEKLEEVLNSWAASGWSVKAVATAAVPGVGKDREELIVVMEGES